MRIENSLTVGSEPFALELETIFPGQTITDTQEMTLGNVGHAYYLQIFSINRIKFEKKSLEICEKSKIKKKRLLLVKCREIICFYYWQKLLIVDYSREVEFPRL